MFQLFSPNMLKTYENCPKKFYFRYIKNISMPVNDEIFETGKNVHALASYYLRKENLDTSNRDRMIYQFETTSPYDFLMSKHGGNRPTRNECSILEYLLIDMNLKPGVVNVLIDYVLKINNNENILDDTFDIVEENIDINNNVENTKNAGFRVENIQIPC